MVRSVFRYMLFIRNKPGEALGTAVITVLLLVYAPAVPIFVFLLTLAVLALLAVFDIVIYVAWLCWHTVRGFFLFLESCFASGVYHQPPQREVQRQPKPLTTAALLNKIQDEYDAEVRALSNIEDQTLQQAAKRELDKKFRKRLMRTFGEEGQ